MKTVPNALRTVFARRHYALFSLAVAFTAAAFLYAATTLPGQSLQSWLYSTPIYVKFLVLFGSVLIGLIAAVQLFSFRHFRDGKKRHSATTACAFLSTLVATACCSPFLLPFVGLAGFGGSFIFFFHQHQLPIVIVSSTLLVLALHYSCKIVDCEECRAKVGRHTAPATRQ
ncbi:hypothetical protein HYV43_03810 [Candidatus Micrarchaeota archaeon]|nr:hypothetical protein [Candidatus Micrarchaeota archaeon]